MIRLTALAIAVSVIFSVHAFAATDEEKAEIALHNAEAVVAEFAYVQDERVLKDRYRDIDRVWQELTRYHEDVSALRPQFSLILARAATAAHDRRRVVPLWAEAITLNAAQMPGGLMGLNIEAAHAAASVGEYEQAAQFFAAARAYAFTRGDQQDATRLQLRVQELQVLGAHMQWRDLNDALLDLREYSQSFPMWTLPRLEAILSEAEVRLEVQPEGREKRAELSELKAQIILMQKGMGRDYLPASFIGRIRTLFYALEDNYKL